MEVVNYLRNLSVNYVCKLRKLQTVLIPAYYLRRFTSIERITRLLSFYNNLSLEDKFRKCYRTRNIASPKPVLISASFPSTICHFMLSMLACPRNQNSNICHLISLEQKY